MTRVGDTHSAMMRSVGRIAGLLLLWSGAAFGAEVAPVPALSAYDKGVTTPAPGTTQSDVPIIMDARIGEHPDRTRFVVEVSDPIQLRVFTLADPDRVVIDMPEVRWHLGGADRPSGRGAIKSYRFGLFRPGNSRLVIDLARPVSIAEPLILPPQAGNGYRIVVDLLPATEQKFAQSAGWPSDLRAKELAEEQAAAAAVPPPVASAAADAAGGKRVIVLDPGHGGIDSGTTGVNGEMEKDLVLDEAVRVQKLLSRRGYLVRLTRDSDVYVPLRERVYAARNDRADLFISLHADSNPDVGVSGASVYTLSEAGSDREAAALARKENQSDVIAGVDLSGENSPIASILIGLAQRDTMNKSARFAQTVVSQLGHATDILSRDPHRSAGFVVLKAPDVPAVLIELGYLSNPHDCAQMGTTGWRERVASAIADAVERQFHSAPAELGTTQAAK